MARTPHASQDRDDRRAVVWSVFIAALSAAATVLFLQVGYGTRSSVVVGFALGVATVGLLLSVGLLGWVAVSGVDGGSLYPAAGGLFATSLIAAGNATAISSAGEPRVTTVLIVGASVMILVGFVLAFVSELPRD